jgi:hypothetical protein
MKNLTELETTVLTKICQELKDWRDDESGYSCIDHTDLVNIGLSKHVIAGVLGSLTAKKIIQIDEGDDFQNIIYPIWENIDNEFARESVS